MEAIIQIPISVTAHIIGHFACKWFGRYTDGRWQKSPRRVFVFNFSSAYGLRLVGEFVNRLMEPEGEREELREFLCFRKGVSLGVRLMVEALTSATE